MMLLKKISELDVRDIMDYEPENGKLFLSHSRMVFHDTQSIGLLRRDLVDLLGFERAEGVIFRNAWNRGVHEAQNITGKYECEDDQEWIEAGFRLLQMQGFSRTEIIHSHIDADSGTFLMEGIWRESFEADEHLKYYIYHNSPVCASMTGYISGFASTKFNKQVLFRETQCRAMGDPYCQWVGKTVEDWGTVADPTVTMLEKPDLKESADEAHRKIEEQQNHIRVLYNMHRRLIQMLGRGGGIDDVCHVLSSVFHVPLIVENEDFALVSSEGIPKALALEYSTSLSKLDKYGHKTPNQAYILNKIKGETEPMELHVPDGFGGGHRRIIAPIILKGELFGYISMLPEDSSPFDLLRLGLERGSLASAIVMLQEKSAVEVEHRMAERFVDEILSNPEDKNRLIKQGKYLGYNLKNPGYVFLLEEVSGDGRFVDTEKIKNHLRYYFEVLGEKCIVAEKLGYLLVLIPDKIFLKQKVSAHEMGEKVIQFLTSAVARIQLRIGISSKYKEVSEIHRAYSEARQVLDLMNQQKRKDSVVAYNDLGVFRILMQHENPEVLYQFSEEKLGPLLRYDRENKAELTKTLYIYLFNECNMYKTAKKMNLSFSGFRYRLKRIKELYNGDLSMAEERFQLYFALKYLTMINELDLDVDEFL